MSITRKEDDFDLETKDTLLIEKSHRIIQIVIFTAAILYIIATIALWLYTIFSNLTSAIDTLKQTGPSLLLETVCCIIGYFLLSAVIKVMYGLFYDTRKMRMMMEEDRNKE